MSEAWVCREVFRVSTVSGLGLLDGCSTIAVPRESLNMKLKPTWLTGSFQVSDVLFEAGDLHYPEREILPARILQWWFKAKD